MKSNHLTFEQGQYRKCKGLAMTRPVRTADESSKYLVLISCDRCNLTVKGGNMNEATEKWEKLNSGGLQ